MKKHDTTIIDLPEHVIIRYTTDDGKKRAIIALGNFFICDNCYCEQLGQFEKVDGKTKLKIEEYHSNSCEYD